MAIWIEWTRGSRSILMMGLCYSLTEQFARILMSQIQRSLQGLQAHNLKYEIENMAEFLFVSITLKGIQIISTLCHINKVHHSLISLCDMSSVITEVKERTAHVSFKSNIQWVYQMLKSPRGKGTATNSHW